jgi:tetratricopeptide (TPR) repeat protein
MFSLAMLAALALGSGEAPAAMPHAEASQTLPGTSAASAALHTPVEVMALPEGLREQFRAYLHNRSQLRRVRDLGNLAEFLFRPDGLGMRYRENATYTVSEAWQTREANCLSFTLLTLALAREVGLQAYGQEISDTVAWRQEGKTVYRSNHVNAGIRINERRFSIDVASDQVLARDPPRRISDARLLAHYYNNRAVELMELGQLLPAMAHAEQSLRLQPEYASTWNNRGVLQLRFGDIAAAQRDYQRALELDPEHTGALFNLAAHFRRSGNAASAIVLERRFSSIQQNDPFHHFVRALELEQQGELREAARHYRRAIKLHRQEHRFYFGLARVYMALDQPRRAGRALLAARELSHGDSRDRYQAKLDFLRRSGV